jgi:tetratricopeptide (TPR) repeat protein
MPDTADGLPITARDSKGAALLDQAVESYLAARLDTPKLLKRAMAADPGHLMARCFMGYLTRLAGDRTNAGTARSLLAGLRAELDGGAGTPWERDHVTALGLWLDDDLAALMQHFEAMLERRPADLLSLRMLHYLYFYDGDAVRMRGSVGQRLRHFAGHRLEGYVLGMYAFGLEEAGDHAEAERFGREAVERNPADLWATHAVAHVLQMQGRAAEGMAWLDALRHNWHDANNFRCHLDWHQALYHLHLNDTERVLALYDETLAPPLADDFYLDLCNATELLIRLEAAGCDVGDRWQPLTEIAGRHVADTELLFASLHYLMPLARQRHQAAAELVDTLRRWSGTGTHQGAIVRDVGLDAAELLLAWARGDRMAASEHYEKAAPNLPRIGGSHAQREVFRIAAYSSVA